MRIAATLLAVLAACFARAERLLLIPLDSRPAAGQFAQMIGKIADVDVRMPPYELLGRFTTAGRPDDILEWLSTQDLSDVSAVVASTDMVAYGGLIASREDSATVTTAIRRVRKLVSIVRRHPGTKLYAFTSVMRLAPTATKRAAPWRMKLASYYEQQDRWLRTNDAAARTKMRSLRNQVPDIERARYEKTRLRNHQVQRALIQMASKSDFDYLVVGQDDAKPYGPFIPEQRALRRLVNELGAGGNVFFCEGIDQHAAVLVSRAILKEHGYQPRVRVVYSDEQGKRAFASYESKPIEESLRDQILASGARPAEGGEYDYTLYLNTPKRRLAPFEDFLARLSTEADQGGPVAVADINFGPDGAADPVLFDRLWENNRIKRLLAYAGWNTAGNTMGTTIPAANVYLLAKKLDIDPLQREIAQKEFLLHRLVNDYAYHHLTRPVAYSLIDSYPNATREETYGTDFAELNNFVRRDLTKQLERAFRDGFFGQRFEAGGLTYEITHLNNVKVMLPWPRAYEVRLSFQLDARPLVGN